MTKPATGNTWGADEGNDLPPSDAYRDAGYQTNAILPSPYLNNWMRRVGEWITYLRDGDFEDDTTFADDVHVLGTTTLSGATVIDDALHVHWSGLNLDPYVSSGLATNVVLPSAAVIAATISTGVVAWSGIVAPATAGRIVTLYNLNAADAITIKHEETGSTAANRFHTPGGADIVLTTGESVIVSYYGAVSRWLVVGGEH